MHTHTHTHQPRIDQIWLILSAFCSSPRYPINEKFMGAATTRRLLSRLEGSKWIFTGAGMPPAAMLNGSNLTWRKSWKVGPSTGRLASSPGGIPQIWRVIIAKPRFPIESWLFNRDPGSFLMVYYNPHITGQYNPLPIPTRGFFHCSFGCIYPRAQDATVTRMTLPSLGSGIPT